MTKLREAADYTPGAKVHKFEIAGLGQAPYRLVEVVKGRSSCDYCSTGILFQYWLLAADGKRFKVGCDCVLKTSSDKALVVAVKTEQQKHEAELREARAAKKRKADGERITAARALLPTVADDFRALPHPRASQGEFFASKSLMDWAEWMLVYAGTSGRLTVAKCIEAAVEAKAGIVRMVDGPEVGYDE